MLAVTTPSDITILSAVERVLSSLVNILSHLDGCVTSSIFPYTNDMSTSFERLDLYSRIKLWICLMNHA